MKTLFLIFAIVIIILLVVLAPSVPISLPQPTGHYFIGNDFLAGIAALMIALNVVLWVVGWKMNNRWQRDLKATIDRAREATEAANLSARTSTRGRRPYLIPYRPELLNWMRAVRSQSKESDVEVYLDVTNIGQGVGFVDSFSISHEISLHGQQGHQPLNIELAVGRVPVGEGSKWQPNHTLYSIRLSPHDKLRILRFEASLFIYGHIRYFDLSGLYWRTGFMFEFVPERDQPQESAFAVCHHELWYDIEELDGTIPYTPAMTVQESNPDLMLEE